jgi:predicted transcriptional regulator
MSNADPRRTVELTDPRALRAVAHPLRLRLIGLLRRDGPLTATQAGKRLGESAQSCWFHLRQLAKYGLVEEAAGGHGRERPWQATAQITKLAKVPSTPEMAAATELFESVLAEGYFESLMRWIADQPNEPREWLDAAAFGDSLLYLTAPELAELKAQVRALVDPYFERTAERSLRPPDSRMVTFLHLAFPLEEEVPEEER